MTIDQTDIIDMIGTDQETGEVVLTISDQLDWGEGTDQHLYLLQEKINTYLGFIESGDLLAEFPEAENRPVVINVVGKFAPPEKACDFLRQVAGIVKGHGISLHHELIQFH